MFSVISRHAPPIPVFVVLAVAVLVLLALVAKSVLSFLIAALQIVFFVAALAGMAWVGLYLVRKMRPQRGS